MFLARLPTGTNDATTYPLDPESAGHPRVWEFDSWKHQPSGPRFRGIAAVDKTPEGARRLVFARRQVARARA